MEKAQYLVKDIRERPYFWPLIGVMLFGFVLDIHSTWFFVTRLGFWEESRWIVHLFYLFFSPLKLALGPAIFLAMLLSKLILVLLAVSALAFVALATKGNLILFRASFIVIFIGSAYNVYAGLWNYYRYFFAIIE